METFAVSVFLKLEVLPFKPMKKKCPQCRLVNFSESEVCRRCQSDLISVESIGETAAPHGFSGAKIIRRAAVCAFICLLAIGGFYLSLIFTSASFDYNEKKQIEAAINILDEKGFEREVFLLRRLTAFRANDNWLNASTKFENAYAATNFPVEIMTVYPEFFTATVDDVERASILLHEAQHLQGADEKKAYEFVWRNRQKLGWTRAAYGKSVVWLNVRRQTKEYAPHLFVCDGSDAGDCTESPF